MTSIPSSDTPRGRTEISSRAITRVVSAVAAEALGVDAGRVSVDLTETAGRLDITLRTPDAAVPSHPADANAETIQDDTVSARTEQAEQDVRVTVGELTGVPIGGVTVQLAKNRLRLPR